MLSLSALEQSRVWVLDAIVGYGRVASLHIPGTKQNVLQDTLQVDTLQEFTVYCASGLLG